ncbi:Uncharacterised protein [Actinomyces bovis]|uniref:Uncharacterized protein n=1 Tax=Actinomyces bovis TaxID=1658 RepID=A0ABY1VM67_9ACTO|nr:Uncharacterised protein [Actinomyces bovis]VEG54795.1 Uncharacterised protein [Actinomyces israelii]
MGHPEPTTPLKEPSRPSASPRPRPRTGGGELCRTRSVKGLKEVLEDFELEAVDGRCDNRTAWMKDCTPIELTGELERRALDALLINAGLTLLERVLETAQVLIGSRLRLRRHGTGRTDPGGWERLQPGAWHASSSPRRSEQARPDSAQSRVCSRGLGTRLPRLAGPSKLDPTRLSRAWDAGKPRPSGAPAAAPRPGDRSTATPPLPHAPDCPHQNHRTRGHRC